MDVKLMMMMMMRACWDPSDGHSPRMPQKHWFILSYQVESITATAFFTVPQALLWDDFNLSSTRLPGWSRTRGSSTISLLCWGINSTGFPFVSGSNSRSRSLFATPYMVEVRLTSAAPAILSGRLTPDLICGLLHGATWLCLEPGPVALGPGVSLSPDRLSGTHCPRTSEFRNCCWNVSNLCWKHICFAKHMPSSAHSAFVTWLGGRLISVSYIYIYIYLHGKMHSMTIIENMPWHSARFVRGLGV